MNTKTLTSLVLIFALTPFQTMAFIQDGAKFQPDSTVSNPRFNSKGHVQPGVESGEYRGKYYEISSDGVGYMAHWRISCQSDAMTDKRTCLVASKNLFLLVGVQGVEQVVVGYDHSPGSTVSIRIDDEKPYVSSAKGWSGPAAIKLFVALAASAKASFRFVRWPDQAPTDAFMQTIGITEAVDLARWAATTK